ncbi:hypothetical protein SA496_16505 [Pseudomonas sp. JS3066]|jgi:hypothetical protein|uniref:hypothetical protein n=1 Tax=unclassified Pseudomonas TaxID=196821 RepID=UPI000EA83C58|nr:MULTISPECIES: hypothetical protein [unclassified Pseudomonas]AYF86093.1 hypothetical protein D6Z43_02430 [Pseudomonas sp. DY-1]WVK91319.1 hypothetical protein SA496_16505 [Pseudomonas sp. JS3066]
MNQDPHKPDAMERELLEHYRRHCHDEPSVLLDQRILAAAAAQAAQNRAEKVPSWGKHLHAWLFGSGGRQRWAVAVAGFATLGIGLSLTLRTQQEAEQRFDAPPASPMQYSAPAPAAAPMSKAAPATLASPPAQTEKKASAMADSSAEVEARQQEPMQLEEAAPKAEMARAAPPVEPRASLQRVLELNRAGKREEARKLMSELQTRYPERDIAAELRKLERDR